MEVDDFRRVKRDANGMLPVATYQRIHACAQESQGDIVEVGTAHGAATICMAAALRPGSGKVYSFEKIVGGSREKFGSLDENIEVINSNYRSFNVADRICQFFGDVAVEAKQIDHLKEFRMMMLDADGRLDRDFVLFYDRLVPGGYIVIDDCDDRIKLKFRQGAVLVHQKHRLTHLFVKRLEELGFLEKIEVLENTYFGRKPRASTKSIKELSILDTSAIYANLVFSRIDYTDMIARKLRSYPIRIRRKLGRMLGGSSASRTITRR